MSYILDALRRAESERDRGQVPGLNAQPVPVDLGEGEQSRTRRRGVMVAAAAALAVLVVLAAWWWGRPAASASAPELASANATNAGGPSSPRAGDGAPLSSRDARPPGPAPDPAASPGAGTGPVLLVAPPAAAPTSAVAAAPQTPPTSRAAAPRPPPARGPGAPGPAPGALGEPAPAPSNVMPAPAGSPPSNRVTLLSDLPAAQRAELPQMLIGGAIYSDQPASRFIVVNGLVVREGETAAPGVTLERIGPKAAVIRWREMRIELPI